MRRLLYALGVGAMLSFASSAAVHKIVEDGDVNNRVEPVQMDGVADMFDVPPVEIYNPQDPNEDFFTPDIAALPTPLGSITFAEPGTLTPLTVDQMQVPVTWGSWSGGLTPFVFWTDGVADMIYDLPTGVSAFDFYLEPNTFGLSDVTVTTKSGLSHTLSIDGLRGASYFGFYDDTQTDLDWVRITSVGDWATGEMRVGQFRRQGQPTPVIPEPGTIALLSMGAVGIVARRRRR